MKKCSGDIHPRNIPTKFETKCETLVAEIQVLTDGQTDRPMTRHGNKSWDLKSGDWIIIKLGMYVAYEHLSV